MDVRTSSSEDREGLAEVCDIAASRDDVIAAKDTAKRVKGTGAFTAAATGYLISETANPRSRSGLKKSPGCSESSIYLVSNASDAPRRMSSFIRPQPAGVMRSTRVVFNIDLTRSENCSTSTSPKLSGTPLSLAATAAACISEGKKSPKKVPFGDTIRERLQRAMHDSTTTAPRSSWRCTVRRARDMEAGL